MKTTFSKFLILSGLSLCLISLFVTLGTAHAQTSGGVGIDPLLRPKNLPTLGEPDVTGSSPLERGTKIAPVYNEAQARASLLGKITNVILGLAGIVAVFSIVNNGWWLAASGGSEEKVTQHKKGLMWSVLGLVLIILSYSIVRFIISIPFAADQGSSTQTTQPAPNPGGN